MKLKKRKIKKLRMGGILLRSTKVIPAKKGKGSYRRDKRFDQLPSYFFLLFAANFIFSLVSSDIILPL